VLTLSVGLATAAVLGLTRGPVPGGSGFEPADLIIYLAFLAFLAWVVVGAVLVARRPDNPGGRRDHAPGGGVTLAPPRHPSAPSGVAPAPAAPGWAGPRRRPRPSPYSVSRVWRCRIQRRRPAALDS
jgi:hypothetical protein